VYQIALQTVLRHLASHPHAYALWLDTTSTFSAELALQMLDTFDITQPDTEAGGHNVLPPLDRLIVAKTFDLTSAIQAIQSIRNNGFPRQRQNRSESERKEDKPVTDEGEEMGMQVDPVENAAEVAVAKDIGGQQAATEAEKEKVATESEQGKKAKEEMQLTFIVIDSITVLFRNILSGVTTEGLSFSPYPHPFPLFPLLTFNL